MLRVNIKLNNIINTIKIQNTHIIVTKLIEIKFNIKAINI